MLDHPEIRAGDHLIYGAHNWYGRIIQLKTWSPACHIEVYMGKGWSVASRDGKGVNKYSLREEQLIAILRPYLFDREKAMEWFYRVQGQKYDWLGLLCFTLAVKQGSPNKMFCSEFAIQLDRAGGCRSFAPEAVPDTIAPANYLISPAFDHVWTHPRPFRV